MTMQYIRSYYKVPAKRGMSVKYKGVGGVILSADHYVKVRLENKRVVRIHPTDPDLIYGEV